MYCNRSYYLLYWLFLLGWMRAAPGVSVAARNCKPSQSRYHIPSPFPARLVLPILLTHRFRERDMWEAFLCSFRRRFTLYQFIAEKTHRSVLKSSCFQGVATVATVISLFSQDIVFNLSLSWSGFWRDYLLSTLCGKDGKLREYERTCP